MQSNVLIIPFFIPLYINQSIGFNGFVCLFCSRLFFKMT